MKPPEDSDVRVLGWIAVIVMTLLALAGVFVK